MEELCSTNCIIYLSVCAQWKTLSWIITFPECCSIELVVTQCTKQPVVSKYVRNASHTQVRMFRFKCKHLQHNWIQSIILWDPDCINTTLTNILSQWLLTLAANFQHAQPVFCIFDYSKSCLNLITWLWRRRKRRCSFYSLNWHLLSASHLSPLELLLDLISDLFKLPKSPLW